MIKIFQIHYKDEQKNNLLDGFTPYMNDKKSILMESECIHDIRHNRLTSDISHVGSVGYKFHKKVLHKPKYIDFCTTIEKHLDVDIFSPRLNTLWMKGIRQPRRICFPNQLNMRFSAIPFLEDLANLNVIKKSSIKLWERTYKAPVYFNYWVAKREVFLDYVDNFLDKVIDLIHSYDKDNWIFTVDEDYTPVAPEEWQNATGFSNYPIITFILERLINIYIQDRKLNHQAIL